MGRAGPHGRAGRAERGGARPARGAGRAAGGGPQSAAAHDAIGRLAVRLGVDRLVVVGEQAAALHAGAVAEGSRGEESVLVPDVDAAVEVVTAGLRPGDVVLVKASNSAHLERVSAVLLAGAERAPAGGATA